ncbi:MAG: transporter [Bacteroidales bacterium]|jgi:Tol biopolymer transport system component|nr:transporter [Bacteroidales bacterium]
MQSYIEIIDIHSKKREIFHTDSEIVEAPNWYKNEFLLVNSGGLLYKIFFADGRKEQVNTGTAIRCNNDHGITWDGREIIISSHDSHNSTPLAWQTSKIYMLPIEGGEPRLVTTANGSFWHGISPDDTTLIYTALRNEQWDIYAISRNGGAETQLTNSPVQDDGSEFSPCGTYIYYNSYKSGFMEIWRMRADGSEQTQITHDATYSNWFPHLSPDGSNMVYICYLEDQQQAHPFGKRVCLKLMDTNTGEITQLTDEFYGGQGTLNVNSWSPCATKLAFVRYQE